MTSNHYDSDECVYCNQRGGWPRAAFNGAILCLSCYQLLMYMRHEWGTDVGQ